MHGQIDFPGEEHAFDLSGKQSLPASGKLRQFDPGNTFIARRPNDSRVDFQIGPAFLQSLRNHSRLGKSQLTPPGSKDDLLRHGEILAQVQEADSFPCAPETK
jgi:hypothetical protein